MAANKSTPAMVAAMRAMRAHASPASLFEIAVEFDVTEACVYHHVRDIPAPPGGWSAGGVARRIDRGRVVALIEQGLTYPVVAERLGSTPGSLRTLVCLHRRAGRAAVAGERA